MKGLELKPILNRIKKDRHTTIIKIAEDADIDRGLLSTATNKEKEKDVTPTTIEKLAAAFPGYFDDFTTKSTKSTGFQTTNEELLTDRGMIKVLVAEVAKLQSVVYGRDLKDCYRELANSTTLLVEQMKKEAG